MKKQIDRNRRALACPQCPSLMDPNEVDDEKMEHKIFQSSDWWRFPLPVLSWFYPSRSLSQNWIRILASGQYSFRFFISSALTHLMTWKCILCLFERGKWAPIYWTSIKTLKWDGQRSAHPMARKHYYHHHSSSMTLSHKFFINQQQQQWQPELVVAFAEFYLFV